MIPDLPGWDSLPAVTRYHNWAEIAGIIIVALLVVAEVAAYQYGHRKDALTEQQQEATNQRHDEEMARLHGATAKSNAELATAQRDIVTAQAETAKANERTAELKLALEKEIAARQPRHIDPAKRPALVSALQHSPKGKVYVIGSFFDAESTQFAQEIIAVLKEGGFEVAEMPPRPQRPIGYTSPGAWLWLNDVSHPPPAAGPLQRAFLSAGLYLDGQSHPDLLQSDEILIAVSSHP